MIKLVSAPKSWTDPVGAARTAGLVFRGESVVLTKEVADIVRDRVQKRGTGADGVAVEGYSTRRAFVEQFSGLKPKRRPRGALRTQKTKNRNNWIGLYAGGYKEYRAAVGLSTAGFFFSNFGTAWRHWGNVGGKPFRNGRNGGFVWRVQIGFKRREDQVAADDAQLKRPDLFQLGPRERAALGEHVLFAVFSRVMRTFLS